MGPMERFALGLAIVWLDFSWNGLDLLPDPAGWVVAALALHVVAPHHAMLAAAERCSWSAALVSLVTWAPLWGQPHSPPWLLVAVEGLVGVAVVVTVCTAFLEVLAPTDPSGARQARTIRWLDPVLAVVALALAGSTGTPSPSAVPSDLDAGALGPVLVAVVGAGVLVRLWFVVLVLRRGGPVDAPAQSERPAATPA